MDRDRVEDALDLSTARLARRHRWVGRRFELGLELERWCGLEAQEGRVGDEEEGRAGKGVLFLLVGLEGLLATGGQRGLTSAGLRYAG